MSLVLVNLDYATRRFMVSELDSDIAAKALYLSNRLSSKGLLDYPGLLREAIERFDDTWLASELDLTARLNTMEPRKTAGGVTMVKVPVTAAETMAEGEFNRFYARGLCLRAMSENRANLEVYRAKQVSNPRLESVRMIGKQIAAASLLDDLRKSIGTDTALGLPPGPNSGLSVKLV